MALITSHTLNGTDGTHAGGIGVSLHLVGNKTPLLVSSTDVGGRLSMEMEAQDIDPNASYELIFQTADYWSGRGVDKTNSIAEIVLRFKMIDPDGEYHMPIILSPFSYSTWKSS